MRRHQRAGWIEQPLGNFANSVDSIPTRFSYFHALVMTKSAAVESFEACLIVFPLALAPTAWLSALGGALAAVLATIGAVFLLHGRLRAIPEVSLKLWTDVLLSVIGVLWIGEGVMALWNE